MLLDVAEAQVFVSTRAAISHQITRLFGSRQRNSDANKRQGLGGPLLLTAGEATRAEGLPCRAPSWQCACRWFDGAMEITMGASVQAPRLADKRCELCGSTNRNHVDAHTNYILGKMCNSHDGNVQHNFTWWQRGNDQFIYFSLNSQ